MATAKLKIAVGTVVVAALGGMTLVFEHQAQARLREHNRALQQQVEQLARQAEGQSNLVIEANAAGSLPEEQLRELLRLRGEVGVLRQQKDELEKLRAENRHLRSTAAGQDSRMPSPAAKDHLPKESLAFAGYADPDSALQSVLWANTTSDGKIILAGFSPDQQAEWLKTHKTPEGVAAQVARSLVPANMSQVKGFRILNKKVTADDEVFYTVYVEGLNVKFRHKMKKIGSEWKFDGDLRAD